jgi:hypothetical protein
MGRQDPAVTIVQPPPATIQQPVPDPNVQQNAADLYQAQLEYNPQLTAQAVQLQQQYGLPLAQAQANIQNQIGPQLAQGQFEIQQQFAPLYRALYEQLFPAQTQGLETLAQQAGQRLLSPQGLTPEQQQAQDIVRNREQERLLRGIRTQANVGGTLFGGRREQREVEAASELANQYALSDIGLQQQNRAQTLQELIAANQVIFPQVQQPGVAQQVVPQFGAGVTPSPDALLAAIMQNYIAQPAAVGFGPSPFSQSAALASGVLGGIGSIVPG